MHVAGWSERAELHVCCYQLRTLDIGCMLELNGEGVVNIFIIILFRVVAELVEAGVSGGCLVDCVCVCSIMMTSLRSLMQQL